MSINSNYSNFASILLRQSQGKNKNTQQQITLDDLKKSIEFVSNNGSISNKDIKSLVEKCDIDGDSKVTSSELKFFFDVNGDGKLNSADIVLAAKKNDFSRKVVTDEDGNVSIYQFGLLQKKVYKNGSFRIYKRDKNGSLTASTTYRKDGSKYSEETYSDEARKLFNDKSSKPYASRKFYDKNGKLTKTEKYTFKEKSDGKIEKTIIVNGQKNEYTVVTMNKDKEVEKKTYVTKKNGVTTKAVDSDLDGKIDQTSEYKDGKLVKRTWANGRYREYNRDENGKLVSSTTYRKDGTKYSYETYSDTSRKLFNDTSTYMYDQRTLYDKNGNVVEKFTFDYVKSSENSNNVIRIKTYSVPKGKVEVATLDKNKNVKSSSVFIAKDGKSSSSILKAGTTEVNMDNVKEIYNYEDGKLKTSWEYKGKENGYTKNQRRTYVYNEDGSYTVRETNYSEEYGGKNSKTGATVIYEYRKDGTLKTKTKYTYMESDKYDNASGHNIDINLPKTKTVFTYDKNGKITKKVVETYSYKKQDNGERQVTTSTYKPNRNKNGKITGYSQVGKAKTTTETIRHDHNPNNVTADDIIKLARKYKGYASSEGNRYLFGTNGAWCSGFATFIYMQLGIDLSDIANRFRTKTIYAQAVLEDRFTSINDVNKNNQNDLVGQLIMFGNDDPNSEDFDIKHIGIVTSVVCNSDGTKTIKTIEGNSRDEVVERTYIVNPDGSIKKSSGDVQDGRSVLGFADFISD